MAVLERLVSPEATEEIGPFLWTKEQYNAMGELGWFDDLRVELIEGEIIQMSPIGSNHFVGVHLVTEELRRIFTPGNIVVEQSAFNAGPKSEPVPDVAVYAGKTRDYINALPQTALLVVEVSDKTLRTDRTRKASLYAKSGIQEYWIVNLKARQVEVHREPQTLSDTPFGHGYGSMTIVNAEGTISPLARPDVAVAVADMLP